MNDKNNINPETREKSENKNIFGKVFENVKNFFVKIFSKKDKNQSIKSQFVFKRGSYAIVLTAAVLACVIVFNILLSQLSNRVMLEYDMTSDKVNTVSEENIKFIKDVDSEITVTMCALPEDYYGSMMSYYAAQLYGISSDSDYTDYYKQTVKLIERYNDYNKKITVKFADTQDSSFTDITSKYSNESLSYGDIIVSCTNGDNERYKIISYKDIYEVNEDTTYSAYGYTTVTVEGNNIETALTSAIAYVTSSDTKKVAFLTGHSKDDYSETYRELLETNNYEVDVISDTLVSEISDKYDAVFIVAPNIDFLEDELNVIADFLDNGEKYDKGLVFFGDASAPYLSNLYGFLEEWGIEINEGLLFETNSNNYIPNQPTVLGSYPSSDDEMLNGVSVCISGYNLAISPAFSEEGDKAVETLISTPSTVVNAPIGTSNSWKGADDYEQESYATVIKSERTAYNSDNELIKNSVIVFSSYDFIYSEYAETSSVGNKDVALSVADRATGADETGISFVTKVITDESFYSSVTEDAANRVYYIFMIALPVVCIIVGIFVYIRRKNA